MVRLCCHTQKLRFMISAKGEFWNVGEAERLGSQHLMIQWYQGTTARGNRYISMLDSKSFVVKPFRLADYAWACFIHHPSSTYGEIVCKVFDIFVSSAHPGRE